MNRQCSPHLTVTRSAQFASPLPRSSLMGAVILGGPSGLRLHDLRLQQSHCCGQFANHLSSQRMLSGVGNGIVLEVWEMDSGYTTATASKPMFRLTARVSSVAFASETQNMCPFAILHPPPTTSCYRGMCACVRFTACAWTCVRECLHACVPACLRTTLSLQLDRWLQDA